MGGGDLDDLVEFTAFFSYGFESAIRPRHAVISKKGLNALIAEMANLKNA